MKFIKFLLTSLCVLFSNVSASEQLFNHTENIETQAVTSCTTKINSFQGSCIRPAECEGGVYNNLCPGSVKCCVEDVNSSPWLYWRHVSKDQFKGMFPLLGTTRSDVLYPWFNVAIESLFDDKKGKNECNIITAFASQIGHESVDLSTFEEFASGEAYEGRCKQLGNCNSGDGVRFKGRGAIQVTGRTNYQKVSDYLDVDFISKPDLLVLPSYGFQASVWYWMTNKLNQYCSGTLDDFITITKKINGGINGLEDRITKWNRAKSVMGC
jgi:putative chitinase